MSPSAKIDMNLLRTMTSSERKEYLESFPFGVLFNSFEEQMIELKQQIGQVNGSATANEAASDCVDHIRQLRERLEETGLLQTDMGEPDKAGRKVAQQQEAAPSTPSALQPLATAKDNDHIDAIKPLSLFDRLSTVCQKPPSQFRTSTSRTGLNHGVHSIMHSAARQDTNPPPQDDQGPLTFIRNPPVLADTGRSRIFATEMGGAAERGQEITPQSKATSTTPSPSGSLPIANDKDPTPAIKPMSLYDRLAIVCNNPSSQIIMAELRRSLNDRRNMAMPVAAGQNTISSPQDSQRTYASVLKQPAPAETFAPARNELDL